MVGLAADTLDEAVAQVGRREQEVVEAPWARATSEEIEELGKVLAERFAASEEPEIAVDATRPHIVVAGGEMAVAPDAVGLLPHDEARLAVGLEARAAVDDVSPDFLERAGPADVRLLVEARLQLHEDGDLLAVLDGRAQRVRDGRGWAHAIERHLDGEHLGIDGGLAHEAGDRVEGVVGVMHENVPRPDGAPDVGRALERGDRMRRQRPVLEPGDVDGRVELEQIRERREAIALVQVLGRELQFVEQRRQDIGGRSASYCSRTAVPRRRSRRLSSMLASRSSGRPRGCRSASRVTRMAWLDRMS